MAEIVRRRSCGGGMPLGRHASISGFSFVHSASPSIAPPHSGGAKRPHAKPAQGRTGRSTPDRPALPFAASDANYRLRSVFRTFEFTAAFPDTERASLQRHPRFKSLVRKTVV